MRVRVHTARAQTSFDVLAGAELAELSRGAFISTRTPRIGADGMACELSAARFGWSPIRLYYRSLTTVLLLSYRR